MQFSYLLALLAFHSLTIFLTVTYARSNWHFSPFFQAANAQNEVDRVVKHYSERIGEIPDVRNIAADNNSSFCVAIQSVDRETPYLWATVGSLLLQSYNHRPPIYLFRPEGHDSHLEPLLPKLPVRRVNSSQESLSYAEVIRACPDKPYTLVLEDDVWVSHRLEKEINNAISLLERKQLTKGLCYVKLFAVSWVNYGLSEFFCYVLLFGLPYAGLLFLCGRRNRLVFVAKLALALSFVACELWVIGRNDLRAELNFWRAFQRGQWMSTLAMLFPQSAIPDIAACLAEHERFVIKPSDSTEWQWPDRWLHRCCSLLDLKPYNSHPHVVQHIGTNSSRTGKWNLWQTAYFRARLLV